MRNYPFFVEKRFTVTKAPNAFEGADVEAHYPNGEYVGTHWIHEAFFNKCENAEEKPDAAYLAQIVNINGKEVWGYVGYWDKETGRNSIEWNPVFENPRWNELKEVYRRKSYMLPEDLAAVQAEMAQIAHTENLDSVDLELPYIRKVLW
jgi:hypothetical protein